MKEMARYGFILTLICAISASLLAGVNSLTKPRILAQAQAEEEAGLKEVIPQGKRFEAVKCDNEVLYYKVYGDLGKFIGAAFKASAKGYSSNIETLVGMLENGEITAIKILSQNETPGLGANIIEPAFTRQFAGKKDLGRVEAITGATISSKAVIDSVQKKAEEIKELIKNER